MFRAVFLTFFGTSNVPVELEKGIHGSPPTMAIVLAVLAGASVVAGFIGLPGFWRELLGVPAPFYDFLAPVLGTARERQGIGQHAEVVLMLIAVLVALLGILLAWFLYVRRRGGSPGLEVGDRKGFIHDLVNRGYYVDALYDDVVVRFIDWLSGPVLDRRVEPALTEIAIAQPARAGRFASRVFAGLQTGNLHAYVLYALAGLAVMLWWGAAHG
jgi:NADH-quinone oxidoreductase subunit L